MTDITKGTKLKKAVTNDRSAPLVEKPSGRSIGPPVGGAPPIPGQGKPPTGLAPPVPGAAASNRARSNSDQGSGVGGDSGGTATAPQLGGIFAGVGIPKLRKTGGGVDTGADKDSSYISDPETSQQSAPKPPASFAPKPPLAPRMNALRPVPHTTESSPPQPSAAANPLVANLRKPPSKPAPRPNSEASFFPPRGAPPPPTGAKPPPPPITSRKPSTAAPPPPVSAAPSLPPAPPPPPASAPRIPPSVPTPSLAPPPPPSAPRPPPSASTPPSAPPQPPSSAPRPPPARSTPPPPPSSHSSVSDVVNQSIAMQAARNAYSNGSNSPAAPPPPPPPISSPLKQALPASPPPAPSAPPTSRSTLDPSSYTLSNGTNSNHRSSSPRDGISPSRNGPIRIEDSRWRFQPDSELPKPREFIGGPKRYRAGRGSSVPLDLSQFR